MGKQLKKAQVAMEFVFLVGLAFTVMVVFISSTRSEFDELRTEEERSLLKDVTVMAQHELIIASTVEDGYHRVFEIPTTINGIDYTITITNDILLAQTEDYEYDVNIPSVTGNVVLGNNTIEKTDGIVYLN